MSTPLPRWAYFLRIAEAGSVSRVAEHLGLTQSALSRQMSLLEQELGASLFRRTGRGVALTVAGAVFRKRAEDILGQISGVPEEIAAAEDEPAGMLAFGAPPFMGRLLTGSLVADFVQRHPLVRMRVRGAHTFQLREALLLRDIDIGILSMPIAEPDFIVSPLLREQMHLVGPPGAAIFGKRRSIAISALADLPLILTPRPDSLRSVVESAFESAGRVPKIALESEYAPMDELIVRGLGYTILPGCALVNTPLAGFPRLPVQGLELTWAIAHLRATKPSLAARLLIDDIRTMAKDLSRRGIWKGEWLG